MATSSSIRESFDDSETRHDEMHSTIEAWVEDLVGEVNDVVSSNQFKKWLEVQSHFHDYSHRNTLLIKLQCPEATKVAGYNTWRNDFDRHVKKGEQAIWIWAPIITKRCPECQNSPSYHEQSNCEYNETAPEDWSKGLAGFKPTTVFDVSQTKGEPLPELETEATGDAKDLIPALTDSAANFGVTVRIVDADDWKHGTAKGVCKDRGLDGRQPVVEAKARPNQADFAVTLIHEYAHALLHFDLDDETERSKRELEAEAVGYIVGRYFGLNTSGSAFYLAAWQGDKSEAILVRLGRIRSTAKEIIDTVEAMIDHE